MTSTSSWNAIEIDMTPVDSVECAMSSPNPLCGSIAAAIVQCVVDCASSAACRYGSVGASRNRTHV